MSIKSIFQFYKRNKIIHEESDYICRKYEDYIQHFKELQNNEDYAPIAAFEKINKEINATAFLVKDDSVQITVEYVIDYWKEKFNEKILNNEIISFIILYHIQTMDGENKFKIAKDIENANSIALYYKDKEINKEGVIIIPYRSN